MKILIADDHAIVREGLKTILKKLPTLPLIKEVDNGLDAFDLLSKQPFDIAILDISMPGINGLELLQRMKRYNIKTNSLILSMHPHEEYAIRALKLGAAGYLTKDSISDELIQAILKVAQGKKYISLSMAEQLATNLSTNGDAFSTEQLSEREYQVMLQLAKGKSVTEIANEMFLSSKTVSTYRTRILAKMGMKKNVEISLYAIKKGLID